MHLAEGGDRIDARIGARVRHEHEPPVDLQSYTIRHGFDSGCGYAGLLLHRDRDGKLFFGPSKADSRYRHRVAVVAPHRHADITLVGRDAVRGVEGGPAEA